MEPLVPLPLSSNQERFWWVHELTPETRVHNCPLGLRVNGQIDLTALRNALIQLTRRQPALRTVFQKSAAGVRSVILSHKEFAVPFDVIDLTGDGLIHERLGSELTRDLATPFDLSAAPPWRFKVFRLGAGSYYFHLNLHHIVSDAWSFGVFFRELSELYQALIEDREPSLAPFITRELDSDHNQTAAECYWLEQLSNPPPVVQLPKDFKRPEKSNHDGGIYRWSIDALTLNALRREGAQRKATLYVTLLAAYAVLLKRYSGQNDLIVGTMFSGRTKPEQSHVIGCFANTLAMRLRFLDDDTFEHLLGRVRTDVLNALKYQDYPFQQVIRKLQPNRYPGSSVLFSTLFILQNTMGPLDELFKGLETELIHEEEHRAASEFDLLFQARESRGELHLSFEYRTDLFKPQTIERLAKAFNLIVKAIAHDGWDRRISRLSIVSDSQRRRIIEEWNDTDVQFSGHSSFLDLFCEQTLAQPDSVAVIAGTQRITYDELNRRANRLAHHLRRQNVGSEVMVGVCCDRSIDMVVAQLGILKAGGAYVALDPMQPKTRLEFILADANVGIVVTQSSLRSQLSHFKANCLCIDSDLEGESEENPDVVINSNDLAYVIYTSGSTGHPKGVLIEHKSLFNLVSWGRNLLSPSDFSRTLCPSSICFDSSVFEIFAPLSCGGAVVIAENALHLPSLPAANELTLLITGAPTAVRELVRINGIPKSVRVIILAGEPVQTELVRDLYNLSHVRQVLNLYGPTEATVYATSARIEKDLDRTPPIGRPIANTQVYLLDDSGQVVPVGVPGELHIGGVGVARGYLNQQSLTAERFVADPFRDGGHRLFRTGDLARYREDGNIEFIGRTDHQIKLRGYRIELEEIEVALRQHPSVNDCLVKLQRAPNNEPVLIGYYAGASLSNAELRQFLRARLPEYMIPSYFVALARLPLNANGKIDRLQLPLPDWDDVGSRSHTTETPTELEALVAEIWARALGLNRVDLTSNFFELGGHSLLIPLVRETIRERLGARVDLTDFFQHPSVREFARFLAQDHAEEISLAKSPQVTIEGRDECTGPVENELAVVGFSCRLPGANTPEVFWQNLRDGLAFITEVPSDRWNHTESKTHLPGQCLRAGFVENVAGFEPEFFNLSMREARWMDPQQRLLLELAWETFERAGYAIKRASGSRVGVFVGASFNDYQKILDHAGVWVDPHSASGNSLSILANRISYLLGLVGPSLTVDTACSSSLVALHLARQSLLAGECELALVGGVSLLLSPENLLIWNQAGMIAADSRCKTFDDSADGYVAGEGGVCLLLKPLVAAIRDGDQVWAVLKSTAVNHDGHSKAGLTAPSPKAQQQLVLTAYQQAGIDPVSITYIETHGTGTRLGDPIEVRGLTEAIQTGTTRSGFCAIGSVKTNIGHLGPAAGLAGVLKTVLALKHREIPATLNVRFPNREIAFESTPFFINDRSRSWDGVEGPRRAGVCSFGFGGANAHAILEEAPAIDPAITANVPAEILCLSARTEVSLRRMVRLYQLALNEPDGASLADVCYTANTGRDVFDYRLALVARSREQLAEQLATLSASPSYQNLEGSLIFFGAPAIERQFRFGVRTVRESLLAGGVGPDEFIDLLSELAQLFVMGHEINWAEVYAGRSLRRVTLPTYSFERRRCWIESTETKPVRSQVLSKADEHAGWFRQPVLTRRNLPQTPGRLNQGAWLIFADSVGVGNCLADEIRMQGVPAVVVKAAQDFKQVADDLFEIDSRSREHYARLFSKLREQQFPITNIVHLWSLSIANEDLNSLAKLEESLDHGVRSLFQLVKAASSALPAGELHLRIVSGHSQSNGSDELSPARAACFGLAKAVAREWPQIRSQYIHFSLDRREPALVARALLEEFASLPNEQEVSYRNGQRFVFTFETLAPGELVSSNPLRARGVYLITGARGGIGSHLVNWLIDRYDARLILIGSRPDVQSFAGPQVLATTADITNQQQMADVIAEAHRRFGPIQGTFHLAGRMTKSLIKNSSLADLNNVLAPKIHGTWVLDKLTRNEPLDFNLLFSSLAAIQGNVFQAGYSAANSFLDAFARYQFAQGRNVQSINWGGWAAGGMDRFIADRTLAADLISPVFGFELMERALTIRAPQLLVAHPEVLSKTVTVAALRDAAGPVETPSARERARAVVSHLLSEALEVAEDAVDPQQPFIDLGVDSIIAMRFAETLSREVGARFLPTLLFDYATVEALSEMLVESFPEWAVADELQATFETDGHHATPIQSHTKEPIAIIGMAGRFPGAPTLDALWENLSQGVDAVREVPWTGDVKWAAFLENADLFDPYFFRISPREAEEMDPQQRLLLEVAWETVESAAYGGGQLARSRTGVFIGASQTIPTPGNHDGGINQHTLIAKSLAIMANRVSYFLNLTGPCLMVDTLCSSSLVALHLAVQSLRLGECDYALAGGVRVGTSRIYLDGAKRMNALSAVGRCQVFDKSADGIVTGEGLGVVLLKPLSRAVADGDYIHGVILGTSVNHTGQGSGLIAPSAGSQAAVIRQALADADVSADSLTYVEAHGTGTALGDPIEFDGLSRAFRNDTERRQFCSIGSIKSNLGHLEPAAGIAGLFKVLLSMRAGKLVPSLHFHEANPLIDFEASPFYVNDRLCEWKVGVGNKRRAGLSAFGIGGVNAHAIIEEASARAVLPQKQSGAELFTLSARSIGSLRTLARVMANYLSTHTDANLGNVCFSLNTGRAYFPYRLAVVAESLSHLIRQLNKFAAGELPDGVFTSSNNATVLQSASTPERVRVGSKAYLERLAQLYVSGTLPDWNDLYQHEKRYRVPLPTYPFERMRFAVKEDANQSPAADSATTESDSYRPPSSENHREIQRQHVVTVLRESVAQALSLDLTRVQPDVSLLEMGADSLSFADIMSSVVRNFGVSISWGQVFDELKTIDQIADYVYCKVVGNSATTQSRNDKPVLIQTAPPEVPVTSFVPFQKIDPQPLADLSARQNAYLENFVTEYVEHTRNSKRIAQQFRSVLADSRGTAGFRFSTKEMLYPIVAARASGSRLWDVDGNEYLDVTMGFGVQLFGHQAPFIVKAIKEELELGFPIGPQSARAGIVAQQLCTLTNSERAVFCNSGTEAVMLALRLARTRIKRRKIAIFEGAYHGFYDGTLHVRAGNSAVESMPMAPGLPHTATGDVLVLKYGESASIDLIRTHASELAAVLVEPVQSRRPDFQPREFLQALREVTRTHGVALIFDEVITGFRLAQGGAQEYFGVKADLATYGKILGGGLPVGAVAGSAEFLDAVDGGPWQYGDDSYPAVERTFFASTFSKNPIVMAATAAVLEEIERQGPALQENLQKQTTWLAHELNQRFVERNHPFQVVHCGSLFRFVCSPGLELFFYQLIRNGVYVWEGRNFFLSTAHTEADLKYLIEAVDKSVASLDQGGFFDTDSSQKLPAPAARSIPLSNAQRELWLQAKLGEEASIAYNEPIVLQLRGTLDLSVLHQALEEIVKLHSALRTTFTDSERQLIHSTGSVNLPLTSLEHLGGTELNEVVARSLRALAHEPFHLEHGPLLRAQIFKLGPRHHLLALVAHHIIMDGPSFGVLFQDLARLYNSKLEGQDAALVNRQQYSEFITWQREQTETTRKAREAEEYWSREFSHDIPLLELPTDRARPAVKTYRGGRIRTSGDAALARAVSKCAATAGCTPFMLLLATYKVWLHRLTGHDDLVVGIPWSNWSFGSSFIGHRINMLPIRTKLEPELTFLSYLETVREKLSAVFAHAEYPPSHITQNLHLKREPSRSPFFDVEFNMEPVASSPRFLGLDVEYHSLITPLRMPLVLEEHGAGTVELESGTAKFDLTLSMEMDTEGIRGVLEYNSDLFDPGTAANLYESFWVLLNGVVTDPTQALHKLPLVSAGQYQLSCIEWNRTRRDYPVDKSFNELFEAQVQRTPAVVAAIDDAETVTYEELNQRANRLAKALVSSGVRPATVVSLFGSRDITFLTAILAVLKAGAAYVPLDPAYPQGRIDQILNQSRAPFVLLTGAASMAHAQSTVLDARQLMQHEQSQTNLNVPCLAHDLAYVIYTSGSTGTPKGAMVEHAGMLNHQYAKINDLGLRAEDVIAQTASQCFDISVWQFLGALLIGASIRIATNDVAHDPERLLKWIEQQEVTVLETVPSLMRELLNLVESDPATKRNLRLRWLIPTGEALPLDLCNRWLAAFPHIPLMNAYGPTECSDDVTHCVIAERLTGRVPIGRPIGNMRAYILDQRRRNPLPIGAVGELWLGGIGVGRGYLNDEERTVRVFIPDPFSSGIDDQLENGPAPRLYRTGDLARYRTDGKLEFFGRADQQIKLRGFRIEAGEIETVLKQCSGIEQAIVVAWNRTVSDQRLVAYVVTNGTEVSVADLRQQVQRQLPRYMVPNDFVFLDALPLTPNGKIDRRALPPPEGAHTTKEIAPPRNVLETQLLQIWREALNAESIGITDNFFDLGGHSLTAIRLLAEVRKVIGKQLTLTSFFEAPTVAELAKLSNQEQPAITPLVRIRRGSSRPFFCVHPASGSVFCYAELARRLGDRPFCGLQSIPANGAEDYSVARMAEKYIAAMRAEQPEGPYLLSGWSMGGIVAYEMSQQLRAQGDQVSFLGLFDADVSSAPQTVAEQEAEILRLFTESLRFSENDSGAPPDLFSVFRHNVMAMWRYQPRPYAGNVTLFKAGDTPQIPDETLGWNRFVQGDIKLHTVPGSHFTMMSKPHVERLASLLGQCLNAAVEK